MARCAFGQFRSAQIRAASSSMVLYAASLPSFKDSRTICSICGGRSIADCGLRIANCGFYSALNPQSAFRHLHLEAIPYSEPKLPLGVERGAVIVCDGRDHAEGARGDVVLRVREHARVEDVPGFDSGLEPARPAHRERAERRQIEVPAARAVELIPGGVAEL